VNASTLIIVVLLLALASYWLAIQRAVKVSGGLGKVKTLTSLPRQFGLLTAFWCGIPSLIILFFWSIFESTVIDSFLLTSLPDSITSLSPDALGLYLNDVRIMAEDIRLQSASNIDEQINTDAANQLINLQNSANGLRNALILLVSLANVSYILSRFTVEFQSRIKLEKIITGILWACSGITAMGVLVWNRMESANRYAY